MNTRRNTMLQRLITRMGMTLGVAVLLAVTTAVPVNAQTPEGTVIHNVATVSFTDANSNAYATVSASVDVTVGFVAGLDVIASAATVGPASPSANDTLFFPVNNIGSDNDATTVTPNLTAAVAVTPDGGQSLQRLPSNGTNYTFTFTVTNNATGPDGFDLLASHPGTAITIVSVNGTAGDSARVLALASGASQSIAVVYSIGNVAAGTVDTLVLKARSLASPATSDNGFADMSVVRPSLTIVKVAFRDDKTTPV